jgi:hypothetical protein
MISSRSFCGSPVTCDARSESIHVAASIAIRGVGYFWTCTIIELDEPVEQRVHERLGRWVWGIWGNVDVDGLVNDVCSVG